MKTSVCHRTRGPKPITRFYTGFRRFGALVAFVAMLAATFYSASSASESGKQTRRLPDSTSHSATMSRIIADQKNGGTNLKGVMAEMDRGNTSTLSANWFPQPVPVQSPLLDTESIATYASDCETPKTTFTLGQTVCVRVTNAPLGPPPQRQITWVGPDGFILQYTDVTPTQQGATFLIPTSATTDIQILSDEPSTLTLNNRGTWRVNTISTSDATLRAVTEFVVADPANPVVDLSVAVNQVGVSAAPAGGNVAFTLEVDNKGPDAAQSVEIRSPVPANTTFAAIVQNAGPAFTCVDPGAGNTGTTVCSGATLGPDERASFTVIYQVAAGTPDDTLISSSATATNSVPDLGTFNDAGTGAAVVGPASCALSCPANIVQVNDDNASGAIVTFVIPSTSCSNVVATPESGSFFPLGTTPVTITGGSGSICSFTVTVNDTQVPTITCPTADVIAAEDPSTPGYATVDYILPSVTDNEAGLRADCGDHPPGSSFPVGDTLVTCTATDSSGNTSEACSFNVHVDADPSSCSFSCPSDIVVDAPANACSANVTFSETSNTCGTLNYSHASGSSFPVGTTPVTVTGAGRSCTFTVTVKDTEPPNLTIAVPPSVATATADANCQAQIPDFTQYATATDSCTPRITISQDPAAETLVGVGTHTITITAIDGDPDQSQNSTTITTTFTVEDKTPPTIALDGAPSITVECHTSFTDPGATATDACAGSFAATPSATVDVNTPGSYTINYTASDPAGNAGTPVSRTVNVVDTTAPTIALNGASSMTVECHTGFTDPGATATDGCAGSFAATPSGTVDANTPGSYTITYTASDPAGNAGTPVSRTVNVVDTTPPVIGCPANIVVVLPPNNTAISMPVSYPTVTATDSCAASVNVTSSPASGSVFPLGTTVVNASATDASGNTSSCSFTVTVLYNFTGFFQPVDNLPVLNTVNAGRAIPVKFSLSGNKGLAIFATGYPASGVIACNSNDPVNEVEETLTAGSSSLSYDASSGQYIYVWKTNSAWAGTCRQLIVKLNDGSEHRANFKFR
jgi:uncharacterized repeat protein (TIGR01451 family)